MFECVFCTCAYSWHSRTLNSKQTHLTVPASAVLSTSVSGVARVSILTIIWSTPYWNHMSLFWYVKLSTTSMQKTVFFVLLGCRIELCHALLVSLRVPTYIYIYCVVVRQCVNGRVSSKTPCELQYDILLQHTMYMYNNKQEKKKIVRVVHVQALFVVLFETWLHDKREVTEGKVEMLYFSISNCQSVLDKAWLQDLRNDTTQRDNCTLFIFTIRLYINVEAFCS